MAESKDPKVTKNAVPSGISEQQQRELEAQLAELCLELEAGQMSAEEFARLEKLLLDHPELQEAYCQLVSLSRLLSAEFNEQGCQFPSLLAGSPSPTALATLPRQEKGATAHGAGLPNRSRLLAALLVVAASVIIVASFALRQWPASQRRPSSQQQLAQQQVTQQQVTETPLETPTLQRSAIFESSAAPAGALSLHSHEAIDLLHRVTNASWQIPSRQTIVAAEELTETLTQGTAQLNPFNGLPAGGYVAVLPPGAELELTVFADSDGENTLAVMELDEQGRPTGQLASFSNQPSAQSAEQTRLYGQIGTWSERNNGAVDKFYLLTGMQQVAKPQQEPSWYVADCSVLVNLPHLLHIGWDDTGWVTEATDKKRQDKDFNDIAATIRIRRPSDSAATAPSKVRTFPALDEPFSFIDEATSQFGFPLTVAPGQRIILSVSGRSQLPNSLTVVDRQTGRVWWQCSSHSERDFQLGAYVIENHTDEGLSLALLGRHQLIEAHADSDAKWRPSSFQVLVDDQRCQMIGFEDLGIDNDWDDVRVNVHWIPE